jgi:hypothetical protein
VDKDVLRVECARLPVGSAPRILRLPEVGPSGGEKGGEPVLEERELAMLQEISAQVPMTENEYVATDFVIALLETVMDYQNSTTTVERAGKFFEDNRWDEIRSIDDLEMAMARFPSDRDGNDALAMYLWGYHHWRYLWGYHHWRRAGELRGLVAYFRERDVTDLETLRRWAATSTERDFVGHVKGLGPTIYQWLVMRAGVETVKPDVHVLRFVGAAIGRPVTESEAVKSLEEVARRLGVSARTLDWSIWEYQRSSSRV